jgi:spore germination protein YaaH
MRIALVMLASAACAAAAPASALTTVMYLVNRPNSIASFQKNWRYCSIIAPQSFSMDAQGFVAGQVPPAVAQTAREHGIAVMPLVVNRGFQQPLMHTVLDSPESRARVIRYLLYYALRDGYIGFQFDYENIHYLYRDRFSAFFHETAAAFHRHGLLLSAAVVGRQGDTRNPKSSGGYDNWSGVYDYAKLARDADFLSIMAYPQHTASSGPGPLGGLPWTGKIVDYTVSQMPARKVSLGIPLYGLHWVAPEGSEPPKWKGRSSIYSDTAALLASHTPEWREEHSAHRLVFTDAAGRHEIWYEDARSLAAKLELAAGRKLAGISAWSLGQEDPAFWEALARGYRIHRPRTRTVRGTFDERSKAAARAAAQGTARRR